MSKQTRQKILSVCELRFEITTTVHRLYENLSYYNLCYNPQSNKNILITLCYNHTTTEYPLNNIIVTDQSVLLTNLI